MKIRSNVIVKEFKQVDTQAKIALFKSQCMSLYGCELWDLTDKNIKKLEVAWRRCCRSVLGLPVRTRSYMIPELMQSSSILTIIHSRILNFYIRGINHENDTIKFFFRYSFFNLDNWVNKNLNVILRSHKLLYSSFVIKTKIKLNDQISDWRTKIISELIYNRDYQLFDILSEEETNQIMNYVSTF